MPAARVIICAFALVLAAHAEPVSQLRPTDYVSDFAHVLTPDAIRKIDNICQQVDQKAHAQIAVVTINSLDGSDIESYAVELFKKWGIGGKSTDRGVLILLAVRERRYRIEVGYGLEPILPDGKVGSFGREAVPYLRKGDYSGALLLLVSRVAETIAQDAGVQISGESASVPENSNGQAPHGLSTASIILLVVVVLIILFTPLRVLLWSLFLGGWGGGSGGRGWSSGNDWGGGFGGGGGGFGGFGGGSSGGGGASGSW